MEEKIDRGELAEKLFREGYNCAQSVSIAFCDLADIDRNSLSKLASSFGGGMGRMREVCGAFSGMCMVLGLLQGYETPETGEKKANHYKNIQILAEKFKEQNGSIICRELLNIEKDTVSHVPEKRTAEYYKKRPCPEIVRNAANILQEFLENDQ